MGDAVENLLLPGFVRTLRAVAPLAESTATNTMIVCGRDEKRMNYFVSGLAERRQLTLTQIWQGRLV